MKFKITLMLLLIASMLKAQETRIVFNAPASTPADATVTLMIWTAIEYEPGQWLGFGDDYTGDPSSRNLSIGRKRATEFIL